MGLDGVSLIVACEERFGISVSDQEAESCLTVGDLQDLVVRKVRPPLSDSCLTRHVFYRLRRGLCALTSLPRRAISPGTPLAVILPGVMNPTRWNGLGDVVALRLPSLAWPEWAAWSFAVAATVLLGALVVAGGGLAPWLPAGFVAAGALATLVLLKRLDPATRFPVETVGDLARRVLSLNLVELRRSQGASEHDVRAAVLDLICDELGVTLEQAVPAAEFVRDLGVG